MSNGLYNGLENGLNNGLYNGLYNGLHNGLENEVYSKKPVYKLGTIISDSFDRASLGSDWTIVGTPTISLDGTDMTFGGGAGTYTNYIYYNKYVLGVEDLDITINFKVNSAINATNYGIAIGFKGTTTWDTRNSSYQAAFFTSNVGKLYCSINGANTISSGTLTASQNDEMRLVLSRRKLIHTLTLTNLSNGQTNTITRTFSQVYPQNPIFTNLSSYLAIYAFGGSQVVHDITVTSQVNTTCDILGIGDSIMSGLYSNTVSGSTSGRYMDLINATINKNMIIRANPSDRLVDINLAQTTNGDIKYITPKKVLLHIGTNDVTNGRTLAAIQSDYQTLVNSYSCTVYHCLALPRNGVSVTAFNNWLTSTYGVNVIDTYTPFNSGGNLAAAYNSGDNVHPNIAGHKLLRTIIQPYLLKL